MEDSWKLSNNMKSCSGQRFEEGMSSGKRQHDRDAFDFEKAITAVLPGDDVGHQGSHSSGSEDSFRPSNKRVRLTESGSHGQPSRDALKDQENCIAKHHVERKSEMKMLENTESDQRESLGQTAKILELERILEKREQDLIILETKLRKIKKQIKAEEKQKDFDRLDFLLSDFKYYIKIGEKIQSQSLNTLTQQEGMILESHGKQKVYRPEMFGVFDRQNDKVHCSISSREILEARNLLSRRPDFVNGIERLNIKSVENFIKKAEYSVKVVEDYCE